LSHYYFHNHSKRFWNLVAQYIPDYKLLRKKLNSV
jgi:predicted metal-dependent hydrolase